MKFKVKKHTTIETLFNHNVLSRYGEVAQYLTAYGSRCIWEETMCEYEQIVSKRESKLKSLLTK